MHDYEVTPKEFTSVLSNWEKNHSTNFLKLCCRKISYLYNNTYTLRINYSYVCASHSSIFQPYSFAKFLLIHVYFYLLIYLSFFIPNLSKMNKDTCCLRCIKYYSLKKSYPKIYNNKVESRHAHHNQMKGLTARSSFHSHTFLDHDYQLNYKSSFSSRA